MTIAENAKRIYVEFLSSIPDDAVLSASEVVVLLDKFLAANAHTDDLLIDAVYDCLDGQFVDDLTSSAEN